MNCCSICCIYACKDVLIDMYYSKLKQSEMNNKYVCFKCYREIETREEEYIQSNFDNIQSIIKSKYLEDYIKPEPEIPIIINMNDKIKTNNNTTNHINNNTTKNITNYNTTITNITRPITIYKIVKKTINDVERDMVLIDLEDYRIASGDYRPLSVLQDIQTIEKELRRQEALKRQEECESRRMEEIAQREAKDKIKEQKPELKERREIEIRKSQNEIINKRKSELLNEYKHIPNAKIEKCGFCKDYKVHPVHYLDENNNKYMIKYTVNENGTRYTESKYGCSDCYEKQQNKKEDNKLKYIEYCHTCKCNFTCLNTDWLNKHINSNKHKKNMELMKLEASKEETQDNTPIKIDLSKLPIRELHKICSKSLNDDGLYRINNYTKMPKKELLEKMNEIYELLKIN